MWQKILKQSVRRPASTDGPFYVEEVEGGKLLRLEGYDEMREGFPVKSILLPQVGGNPLFVSPTIPGSGPMSSSSTNFTDEAIKTSIGFLNGIVNQLSGNITDIEMGLSFPRTILRIDITSHSNRSYTISILGKLYGDSDIDITGNYNGMNMNLCIDATKSLPIGDTLGNYIISLVNDEQACSQIGTLEDFVEINYNTEITCEVCFYEIYIHIHDLDDYHQCPNCNIAGYSNVEVEPNEPGETFLNAVDYDVELRNPSTGGFCIQIYNVEGLGGYGDKYFVDEDYDQLLHYNPRGEIEYYKSILDDMGRYHASLEEVIEFGGHEYEQMSTGLYHKLIGDGIESRGYDEEELEEEEE